MTIEQEQLIERYLLAPWRFENSVRLVHTYLERNYSKDGCRTTDAAYELLALVEALFDERKQLQAK